MPQKAKYTGPAVLTPAWYAMANAEFFKPYGRHVVPQIADGACFFHAIANWAGKGATAASVRALLVDKVLE